MTEFFIRTVDGKLKPVDGEAVVIPGFEQVKLFISKDANGFGVTEASTGCAVHLCSYLDRDEAIAAAQARLQEKGLREVQKAIKKALATYRKENK